MSEFKSRAVRRLVELHESELRSALATWKRFKASGRPMPDPHGDPDYESPERLVAHMEHGNADPEFQQKAEALLIFFDEYFGVSDFFDKPPAVL